MITNRFLRIFKSIILIGAVHKTKQKTLCSAKKYLDEIKLYIKL